MAGVRPEADLHVRVALFHVGHMHMRGAVGGHINFAMGHGDTEGTCHPNEPSERTSLNCAFYGWSSVAPATTAHERY